jgi:hypothetical protein
MRNMAHLESENIAIMHKALLHLVWSLLALGPVSIASAQGSWPPAGSGWPPPGGGGTNTGNKLPDSKHVDASGDPVNLEIGDNDPLGEALDELERVDPVAAGEIRTAHTNGAFGFYAIQPGQGVKGVSLSRAVLLVIEGRSRYELCGTLAHEWEHERRRHGYDDGTPDSGAAENAACGHTAAVTKQLQVMADLQLSWFWETGNLVITCAHIRDVEALCNSFHKECLDSGGTPAGDCAVPILQNCP